MIQIINLFISGGKGGKIASGQAGRTFYFMLLGFKTQRKINLTQRQELDRHAGIARHAYNWRHRLCSMILSHNSYCIPEEKIKFRTAIDLRKWLNNLVKLDITWYSEVSKCSSQYALRHLDWAELDWFKNEKDRPKFNQKGRQSSFTLDRTIKILSKHKIQFLVIGRLTNYEKLLYVTNPKNVTISGEADRWFIYFKIDQAVAPIEKTNVVGTNLGIKALATLSTGETIKERKAYKNLKKNLARLEKKVSRNNPGSANCKKAVCQVQKLYPKITNLKKDTLHKLISQLCKNHALNTSENLNVSGMMTNHQLAKSVVADMGFYEFWRQMEYKSQLYGSKLLIVDRFCPSSKTGSNYGTIEDSLLLSERLFD